MQLLTKQAYYEQQPMQYNIRHVQKEHTIMHPMTIPTIAPAEIATASPNDAIVPPQRHSQLSWNAVALQMTVVRTSLLLHALLQHVSI